MRIYSILTNKADFERLIAEKADHKEDEFFLITESLETFRAIAVDKFYNTELLNSLLNVYNLIVEKLFSERVYQEHLTDDDPVEQALNELAVMVSRNIEFCYKHELKPEIEGFCFEIYEPEYRSKAINDALETGLSFYEYQSSFL